MNVKRFYRKEFPDVDDIVIMKINREDEYGYYGDLLEYENIEGFVALSELIKGKYMKKKHPFKKGDLYPFTVIRINYDKNTVDVSKKRTETDDGEDIMIQYRICGNINKLINEFYTMYMKYYKSKYLDEKLYNINDIMDVTIWKLYDDYDEYDYQDIYNKILGNPIILLPDSLFEENFIEKAIENINNRITKKDMIMEMNITLVVFEDDAIEKIKDIFNIDGMDLNDDYKIQITLKSTPVYKIKIEGQEKEIGYAVLAKLKEHFKNRSNKYKCVINFEEPKVITDTVYEIKFISDYDLEKIDL